MNDSVINKSRAPRNRTLVLSEAEMDRLESSLLRDPSTTCAGEPPVGIALGDFRDWLAHVPNESVDLLFLDPPYNLNKSFGSLKFSRKSVASYTGWLRDVVRDLVPLLKATATVYICGDWKTSHSIFEAASEFLAVRNRITWEREKGRGSTRNWKNCSEDIWFCTVSQHYTFAADRVKLRRRVLAPYKHDDGRPKDWTLTSSGSFRDTFPSNLWTDISIPFWSMPENTDHPTQKSEKLLAKLILASTHPGDFVLDPFSGSGTSVVVARKLGRLALGIDINRDYCCLAQHRLQQCRNDAGIQGFRDGVFWERNTANGRAMRKTPKSSP